ncbi:ABC transporter permease [Clostridium paraputrificum]|uniref:ABC transporter permease n=1 Tax=Clostridium paraputrificum TaxID=29363 RepID=UPI00189F9C1F|nr:FtsX-like permease family protein [Clostridium paraputrificum]MDB2091333.1 FtsX-like permease family protein [Clostridium paraputrificum]MDU4787342.1 FtsX-like permease family protein [Clostridium sp.]
MRNNFKIAYRFIKSNKAQTTLIALGIALGVTVQLFLGLLINNLNDNLLNKTIGNTSQITVSSKDKGISNYHEIIANIKDKEEDKITNIMGVLDNPAIVEEGDSNKSILVRGLDLSKENDIYDLTNKISEGKFPENENEVLIGKGISEDLNLKVDDELVFSSPSIGEKKVKVTGIVDLKVKGMNDSWVITTLTNSQKIFSKEGEVSSIEMKINNDYVFESDEISKNISSYIPSDLDIVNWKEDNESLLDALSGQKTSSITIQVFIIISVTMSIAGVLAISVIQKSKQIGILKAMGIKDRSAATIFILQGLIFGVVGAFAGGVLGITLFKIFTVMVKTSDGSPLVPGNMYYGFILMSIIISILAAVLASIIAAKKSLKLDPIDIIRNN